MTPGNKHWGFWAFCVMVIMLVLMTAQYIDCRASGKATVACREAFWHFGDRIERLVKHILPHGSQ